MLQRRYMPNYLVFAWTAFDLVLWVGGASLVGSHKATEQILFTVVWGQFIACSGWIALGSREIGISLLALLTWPVLLVLASNHSASDAAIFQRIGRALVVVTVYGWVLTVPLFLLRINGFRFDDAFNRREGEPPWYQSSLRSMMTYTLLVAIVASAWGAILASPHRSDQSPMSAYLTMLVGPFLLPWSAWACFCWLRPLHGTMVATLVTGLWGALLLRLVGKSYEPLMQLMIPTGVLIVHWSALHATGFRLREV